MLMTADSFMSWLEGYIEDATSLSEQQTLKVKEKLSSVFEHEIDPSFTDDPDKQQQMQNIHDAHIINPNKNSHGTILRC